jgi:transketolase
MALSNTTDVARHIRQIILEQSKRAHVGHIGSALSIADIVATLYTDGLRGEPGDPDRDRFVLSKGHAVLAVYAALYLRGQLTDNDLNTYCGDGSLLGVHPEHALNGIDFSTGSLGQGLSIGVGAALAARLQQSSRRVFVLISDAECNEGSTWEAIMFAAHHRLANLIAIVDANQQQALGHTHQVLDLSPLEDRWQAFGWQVHSLNGHDAGSLTKTIANLDTGVGLPTVIVAHTIFGKGVSFMEGKIKWHYWPMSEAEYQQAIAEVNAA